jgi:hypothetical protein
MRVDASARRRMLAHWGACARARLRSHAAAYAAQCATWALGKRPRHVPSTCARRIRRRMHASCIACCVLRVACCVLRIAYCVSCNGYTASTWTWKLPACVRVSLAARRASWHWLIIDVEECVCLYAVPCARAACACTCSCAWTYACACACAPAWGHMPWRVYMHGARIVTSKVTHAARCACAHAHEFMYM